MRLLTGILVLWALGGGAAAGRDVAGVTFPETATVEGKTLVLNGAGVRTRVFFKVYAMGLYLERAATDPAAILAQDTIRRAELHLLRSLTGEEISSAIASGFEANAGDAKGRLAARLDRLKTMFPAVEAGDTIVITYVPGRGTSVVGKGKEQGSPIEGKDFADVLFSVWIGSQPVDSGLKQALLAGGR